jgi:hypothetical protein
VFIDKVGNIVSLFSLAGLGYVDVCAFFCLVNKREPVLYFRPTFKYVEHAVF